MLRHCTATWLRRDPPSPLNLKETSPITVTHTYVGPDKEIMIWSGWVRESVFFRQSGISVALDVLSSVTVDLTAMTDGARLITIDFLPALTAFRCAFY